MKISKEILKKILGIAGTAFYLQQSKKEEDVTQGSKQKHFQARKLPYHFWQCCGSGIFIPDPGSECFPSWIRMFSIPNPNFFHPVSRIRIK
jgi:hypothetical protein